MGKKRNDSLLSKIAEISAKARNCQGDFSNMTPVKAEIDAVRNFLDITHDQAVIFSCLLEMSFNRGATLEGLAKQFQVSVLSVFSMLDEISVLEGKMLLQRNSRIHLRRNNYADYKYVIPGDVLESLRTSDRSVLESEKTLNLPAFLETVFEIADEREDNEFRTSVMIEQIERLMLKNKHLQFITFVNENIEESINKCLIFILAYIKFSRKMYIGMDSIIEGLFDNFNQRLEYEYNLATGKNELLKKSLVTINESEFRNTRTLNLTSQTLNELFRDYPEFINLEEEKMDGIIRSDSIKNKQMFFGQRLKNDVDRLTRLLGRQEFNKFTGRMEKSSLPRGLTVIFLGGPGTGKTETVYQISRMTGRDLFMVDLSQTKSKWFGESEKLIKQVFDDYRKLYEKMPIQPILFINEADGLFTKRLNISGSSTSADRANNTIQNIILQELEDFKGILFATTNLGANLDMAFERRFLFKVEFSQPSPEARAQIWKSRLKMLREEHLRTLSRYELNGAEIENVVRKYMVEKVVDNKPMNINRLKELCEEEKPFVKHRKMGFRR
ncbi:MAG: ATP-binding protein [Bacteroidales bacterium]|nr:ATP-binding protein [Bacteroidales bacterium]